MRFREMRLRIGRVTVDGSLGEGVTVALLSDAIGVALASRMVIGSAGSPVATPHSRAARLAGAITAGVADRIGVTNDGAVRATGGGNGGR
jgi:hypothetical protein